MRRVYPFTDLTGQRFGRLVVIRRVPSAGYARVHVSFLCRCDCGVERAMLSQTLRSGQSKSCGCLSYETGIGKINTTHGQSKSREYRAWGAAKSRCYGPTNISYARYGGRGIRMCDEWRHDFAAFLRDMGPCPEGYSLDRKDNDGDYTPQNCRWSSFPDQCSNTRRNRFVTVDGEEMTHTRAAKTLGVPLSTFRNRAKKQTAFHT